MDFIFANQEFILGLVSALVVWIISRTTGTLIDKAKVNSALAIILDIIQDIKINPATKDLDDYAKKQLAVERATKSLPAKQTNVILKVLAPSEEPSNTCSTTANGSLASARRSKGCSDAPAYFAAHLSLQHDRG